MAKMKVTGSGPTCKCTPGSLVWLVVGVIVVALGIWSVIKGLMLQWSGAGDLTRIVFWYALGLLVICIGRVFKCKACAACFK